MKSTLTTAGYHARFDGLFSAEYDKVEPSTSPFPVHSDGRCWAVSQYTHTSTERF